MKLDEKNKLKVYIHDWRNWTESALFGGVKGGINSEKLEKLRYQTVRGNEL